MKGVTTKEKLLFTWSGGKDSSLALREIERGTDYEVVALLTTVTGEHDRVSMHGVRRKLLRQQAESLGLPLEEISISENTSNVDYESIVRDALEKYLGLGVRTVAFGDIFLEDVRRQREENLGKLGMRGVFPLWKRNTRELAREFVSLGFKAVITCVDATLLDRGFCGRLFDEQFLADLPPGADPCGENGEFHSFVYDGPIFQKPVPFKIGDLALRNDRFWYCDLVPT